MDVKSKPTAEYSKGKPPTGGIDFELGLQTVFALAGLQFYENANWRLSNENHGAGKFDDLVFETDQGDFLLQAKLKQTKRLTHAQFLSNKPGDSDFSLQKYALSVRAIKGFNIKHLILCTNADVPVSLFNLDSNKDNEIITKIVNDCKVYTLNKKFIGDFDEHIKKFQENIDPQTHRDISEWKYLHLTPDDIELFFSKFLIMKASERQIKTEIQEKIKSLLHMFPSTTYEYIADQIRSWYNLESTKAVYMTNIYLKSILFGEESRNSAKIFLNKPASFNTHYEFDSSNVIFIKIKRKPDWYLTRILQGILRHYNDKPEDMFYNRMLLSQRTDFSAIEQLLQCFGLRTFEYLVICFTKMTKAQISEAYEKLKDILTQFPWKKVFILGTDHGFDNTNVTVIDQPISLEMLDHPSKENILNTIITFQGQEVKLEQLINKCDNRGNPLSKVDECVIEKLTELKQYSVGNKIKYTSETESLYISRKLSHKSQLIAEEDFLNSIKSAVGVISGPQGSGKTTLLKKLIQTWKSKDPTKWIISLDLEAIFSSLVQHRDANFLQILCNVENIETPLEIELIRGLEKIIVIDGIDESSSQYIDQLQTVIKKNADLNISVIILASRNYDIILRTLGNLDDLEIYSLEPLSEESQLMLFKEYMRKKKSSDHVVDSAETLFKTLGIFNPGIKHYCSTPLSIQMFVEIIIANIDDSDLLTDTFSKIISEYDFYNYFLKERKKMFVEEGHNLKMRTILDETFNGYLNKLRAFAAQELFSKPLLEQFNTEKVSELSPSLLQVGILEETNKTFRFSHKSFKEYFAAEYIWKVLLERRTDAELLLTIVDKIFLNVQYIGVSDFIEGILTTMQNEERLSDISETYGAILHRIHWNEKKNILDLAFRGHVHIIKLVFDCYERLSEIINIKGTSGETALHLSAHYPHLVKYLTEKGADINCSDENNYTIFHYIIMMYWDSVKYKEYFTNVFRKKTTRPVGSITFLKEYFKLVQTDDLSNDEHDERNCDIIIDLLRYLQSRGLDLDFQQGTTIHYWVAQSRLKKLLVYFIDVCKMDPNILDPFGRSPLHFACQFGAINIVKYLVENCKVDPTVPDNFGYTCAHGAAEADSVDILEYFKAKGLNLSALSNSKETLVHVATIGNAVNVLDYLNESCAVDLSLADASGNTPVTFAVEYDAVDALRYFEKIGLNLEMLDDNGDTLVHLAAKGHSEKVIKYLIENSALGAHSTNKIGNTPLHYAAENNRLTTLKYLQSKCSSLNVSNDEGDTLVHAAARGGAVDVLKYLIEDCKIDPTAPNKMRLTALDFAAKNDLRQVVEYLQKVV